MRVRSLVLISFILFLYSCAGGPGLKDSPPVWYSQAPQDSESQYAFRGEGQGETVAFARSKAIDDLTAKVLKAMNLGNKDGWADGGKARVDDFSKQLNEALRDPENAGMDGLVVARRGAWYAADGSVEWAVDILWDKEIFDNWAIILSDATGVAGPEFRAFEARARAAVDAGNIYEAALLWAAAAGVAEKENNMSAFRLALNGIQSVMEMMDYTVQSLPGRAYVGLRPDEAVVFSVSSKGKPAGDAEFVITYPRASRDGSPSRGQARISSDSEGVVAFRPPEIAFAGTQEITIAPSSMPFLEYLEDPANRYVDEFAAGLETPAAETEYEALPRLRTLPMGIVILETDLAGNPLDSDAAARGLLDDLITDGFDVSIMDLDPREMISRSERALLRDIKADSRFSGAYDRVLHARVSLESFQQEGDNFTVKVGGYLAMSDIERQVTLFRTELTKTSRASSGQQAMTAAFRQLGRSFAEEIIAWAP